VQRNIKKQLAKIFIYPTVVGSIATYMLFFMILFGNSGSITLGESLALLINFGIIVLVCALMYGVYKLAIKKIKSIIEL